MKVYFSFPVSLARRESCYSILSKQLKACVSDVATLLWSHDMSYDKTFVTECDIFVFRPTNNLWSLAVSELPAGVRQELKLAIKHYKSIYMVYTNISGEDNIYDVEIDITRDTINGIKGTSSDIYSELRERAITKAKYPTLPTQVKTVEKISIEEKLEPVTIPHTFGYDVRLLLC